jgi:hypothetical protein
MITNKIENISNIQQSNLKSKLLDFSSRYNNSKMIYYSDFNILTFETYDRIYNPEIKERYTKVLERDIKFYSITKGAQYKPYLVSQDVYGDPGYWWYIMEFNNIFDIEDFTVGKTLRIPPINILSI